MSLMQGLFRVPLSFVTIKREGVLRRMLATSLNPNTLLVPDGHAPDGGDDSNCNTRRIAI